MLLAHHECVLSYVPCVPATSILKDKEFLTLFECGDKQLLLTVVTLILTCPRQLPDWCRLVLTCWLTHCYWLGWYTGMVPANRHAGIRCASCSAVQLVYGRRSCAKWRTAANSSGGLQADFNNAGPFAVSEKVHHANVHLPSITTAIGLSRALLWRPVRLPADRFNNCRGDSSATHCTYDVVYRPVRPRLLVWLYKGVRHRQACNFDEQGGAAEYPRQHLQLDKGVLWTALSLYQICRGMLDGCSGESQCYTRF